MKPYDRMCAIGVALAAGRSRDVFTRDELIAAAGTRAVGGVLPMRFAGGAVDSRVVQRGELFVALRGTQTDGHRFIPAGAVV